MRRTAAAIIVMLLVGACGGGDDDPETASSSSSSSSTVATIAGETTTSAAATGATTATTARGTASATTRAGGSTGTAASNAVPKPAAPGLYRYRQTGSASPGGPYPAEGTLRVDAADASGNQVWHRAFDPAQQSNDTTIAFRADGPYIVAIVQRAAGQTVSCTFDKPVPSPPWPATDGKPIVGHANCGQTSVDVNGSIKEHRTVQLDGATIEVVVATVTIKTTGQITSTSTQTEWWSPALRLTVHSETNMSGKFGAFNISSNIVSDLISGRPS